MANFIDAAGWAGRGRMETDHARAARAAERAARHDRLSASGPEPIRPMHARLADLYRRIEIRHQASAEVHRLFVQRMVGRPGGPSASAFLASIADLLGTSSALMILRSERAILAVAASDDVARKAHDMELVVAEGPVTDAATTGVPVLVAGDALCARWPSYGPAAGDLGIRAALAAPLGHPAARFGAVCALGGAPALDDNAASKLDGIARALAGMLLAGPDRATPGEVAIFSHVRTRTGQDVVNRAIGMVSTQLECSFDDAADLLAARAFAESMSITDAAGRIVSGQLRLTDL